MIEIESQIVKSSEVEINQSLFETENGSDLLKRIGFENIEASSIQDSEKYINIIALSELYEEGFSEGSVLSNNQFLLMLSTAFNEHKPIVLKPDYLWLLICQGVAEHIKNNSSRLMKRLLRSGKKVKIKVRRDDFVKGEINPWEEIFPEFTNKIDKVLTSDLSKNIALEFSTSTIKEKVAFEIAFMDSMSNFIEYIFLSLCGIPEIEIQGTIEDYEKIIFNLQVLKEYRLEWWVDQLIPIIEEIIKTLNGNIDLNFWKSIFKEDEESGGPDITGWITKFFPYTIEYKTKRTITGKIVDKKIKIRNPLITGKKDGDLKIGDFPNGISKVPFKWKDTISEYNMNFISGFIGIKENPMTNFLEPEINWIINEEK